MLFGLVALHLAEGLLGVVHVAGILPGQVLKLLEHTVIKALIMHTFSSFEYKSGEFRVRLPDFSILHYTTIYSRVQPGFTIFSRK